MEGDLNTSTHDSLKLAMEHAWAWFALHSAQRMQLINFFFLASAFVTAGFATSLSAGEYAVAGCIGVAGAVFCVAFARMDDRSRDLVRIAEPAIRHLEQRLAELTVVAQFDFIVQANSPAKGRNSYGATMRAVTLAMAALFLSASGYAFGHA